MRKTIVIFFSVMVVLSALGWAQIAVTSPSVRTPVKAAPDYAAEVMRDPWDMNLRTDLGWGIFNTIEEPLSYLTNISFSGGLFSARTVFTPGGSADYSDAKISLLDSDYPGTAKLGKFGVNYPLNADKYKVLAIRMYVEPPLSYIPAFPPAQLFWSKNTMYNDYTVSGSFMIYGNWAIYLVDIPALGVAGGNNLPWSGVIDSLRFDPILHKDKDIQIDWIRLVEKGAIYEQTMTWTGNSGAVDIYLDNDNNAANGNLGLLAKGIAGTQYNFLAGGLAGGDYYVAVAPAGQQTYSYSPGYYHVNDQPVLNFTKPTEEGSDVDFATVNFANPWDMNAAGDIDLRVNISNPQFTTLTYEDRAGQSFTGNTVFRGLSDAAVEPNVGDPHMFFLNFFYRGATAQIDPDRYHNLTFKMGIAGPPSTVDGSEARVVWKLASESVENVSKDIVIRHLDGRWVMEKIVCDLKTLPLEDGAASPSHSGWTGTIDSFRLDPHEFSSPRDFFVDDVKITADWRADASFPIQWTAQDADAATVALYYDADKSGFNGTLIVQNLNSTAGVYTWNTTAVANGTYYLYAVMTDGTNENRAYAGGPVIILHGGAAVPVINLSKTQLAFGAAQNGTATGSEDVILTNTGQGTLHWQAVANADWISVTPASGDGNAVLRIGISRTNLSAGRYTGTVSVQDPNASNTPRIINVTLDVYAADTDAAPFGSFDLPLEGANVSSSIPVTGWALDDIEVTKVVIKLETGEGQVFISDAIFVEGARPDLETAYPTYPHRNRAGWGYMLLTNFLPNQGNGTYTLHAYAEDTTGHQTWLGSKTFICDNAHAVNPFGAIDTPAQGETISGSGYNNFGWALTPPPNSIPTNGSTLMVWVDGVPIGRPSYNHYRGDIATGFPGYANSDGAVGVFTLDTTAYANKMCTIVWSAQDNAGNEDGIGSRYFNIVNTGAPAPPPAPAAGVPVGESVYSYLGRGLPLSVFSRTGFDLGVPFARVEENERAERVVRIGQLERIEIRCGDPGSGGVAAGSGNEGVAGVTAVLGSSSERVTYRAFQVVAGEIRPLPVGSTFDRKEGLFSWQPGPGFLGSYQILFLKEDGRGISESALVEIRIEPGFRNRR